MTSIVPLASITPAIQAQKNIEDISLRADFSIALITMPWETVNPPSIGLGILKQCLASNGFPVDIHHLNLLFAEQIGIDLYVNISTRSYFFYPDWFFSFSLFGEKGTSELKNSWDDIKSTSLGADLVRLLKHGSRSQIDDPGEVCRRLSEYEVPKFIDSCMESVNWGMYPVIGFTTTFAQSLASLLLAKRIKEKFPSAKIVFGGASVDGAMGVEFARAFEWIDYVVHGEGEDIFPRLVRNIADDRCERIPGITMRSDTGAVIPGDKDAIPVDMNRSPIPDYSEYFEQKNELGLLKGVPHFLYYESSRGCWWGAKHHCTFCGLNGSMMVHRKKSSSQVFDEMLEISRKYSCLTLAATDNILPLDYFHDLLPKLAAADLDLQIFYEIKANLSKDQMRALASAGIRQIQPGIESLNSRLLSMMRKGLTTIQNIQFLKWCYEFDIKPHWNILYGFPGETPDDYASLPELALSLSHLHPPANVARVVFERFSPYFNESASFGISIHPDPAYAQIYPTSRVDVSQIAYFFKETRNSDLNPDEYIMPSREAIDSWFKLFHKGKIICHYRKGPGYIVIEDTRPKFVDSPITRRNIKLQGRMALIYFYCDEIRSLKSIGEMLRDADILLGDEELSDLLELLISRNLMFKEGNRYISLAVRRKATFYSSKKID